MPKHSNNCHPLPRRKRAKLLKDAQTALFELVLAEPTGNPETQKSMLSECREVLGQMRERLHLGKVSA